MRRQSKTWIVARGIASALALAALLGGLFVYSGQRKQAQAQLINFTVGDLERILEFEVTELQEITVDQIRKIIIEQVTKKMIEKIIGGQNGGIGGGAGGTSNGGQAAFVSNYAQFLYGEGGKDINVFIDAQFDAQFPSYISPEIKVNVKANYEQDRRYVPDNCVDIHSIDFENDSESELKLNRALQIGCNEATAQLLLDDLASAQFYVIVENSKLEVQANFGLVKKDERTNELKQSGSTYQGIIQGALQAVYDVQTQNKSAVSSIIGAFVDQILDQLLDQEF